MDLISKSRTVKQIYIPTMRYRGNDVQENCGICYIILFDDGSCAGIYYVCVVSSLYEVDLVDSRILRKKFGI
ncbi:hypothetical protein GCM10008022_01120 [Paenibacillus hunanensis]|nr:hypothetical protein GCM10008022_01120 [Paenibacillus hunanensis]